MSEKTIEARLIEELDRVLSDQIVADKEARDAERDYRARQALVSTREEEAQNLRMALYAMQGVRRERSDANVDNRKRITELKREPRA